MEQRHIIYEVTARCQHACPHCYNIWKGDVAAPPELDTPATLRLLDRAYYTIDPVGNVRFCNHSTTVLGNLLEEAWETITTAPQMARFKAARPTFCKGCALETECQGGCKAAAEVCCGDVTAMAPFLEAFHRQARPISPR